MASETPLRIAFDRARQLQGSFVADVVDDLRALGYTVNYSDKGWIGKLVETAISGSLDEVEREAPDLSAAGVEIKAFGVGKYGDAHRAWEDLRLRSVDYAELVNETWHSAKLFAKMRATIMVPYFRPPSGTVKGCRCVRASRCRGKCDCIPICRCDRMCPCRGNDKKSPLLSEWFFLSPFLWIPSSTTIENFRVDWEAHAQKVKAGGRDPLGNLPDNFGAVLRAATQGQTERTMWVDYSSAAGRIEKAKTRSWFLRKPVVDKIWRENDKRTWQTPRKGDV